MAGTVVGEAQLREKVMSVSERLNRPGSFGGALGSILLPFSRGASKVSRASSTSSH